MFIDKVNFYIFNNKEIIIIGLTQIISKSFPNSKIFSSKNIITQTNDFDWSIINIIIIEENFKDELVKEKLIMIKNNNPEIKILLYDDYFIKEIYYSNLNFIFSGFLSKASKLEEINAAIFNLIYKGKYLDQIVKVNIFENQIIQKCEEDFQELSNMEKQVANLFLEGYSSMEIARKLNIKISTVSTYKTRIYKKMNVANFVQFVIKFNKTEKNI